MASKKILIVEDDKMLSTVFSMFLGELGYDLIGFYENGQDAINKLPEELPDIVLMDIHLPGKLDGIKTAQIIQAQYNIPIIYLTADSESSTIERAKQTHPYGYLIKPIDKNILGVTIEMAYAKHQYDIEIKNNEHQYRTLVEDSPETVLVLVDGFIEYINYAGVRLFGTINIEDLLNLEFASLVDDKFKNEFSQKITKALEGEKNIDPFKCQVNTLEGEKFDIDVVGAVIKYKQKEGIQLIFRNIHKLSSEKEANSNTNDFQQEFTSIKNDFDAIFDACLDGIFFIDSSFNLIDANTSAKKYSEKFLNTRINQGQPILNYLPYINKDEAINLLKNTFEGVSHKLERVINLGERQQILKIKIFPIKEKGKEDIEKICLYFTDITENRNLRKELKELKSELKPIFDSSIQRFYLCNFDYQLVAFNKEASDITKKEYNHTLKKGDNILPFIGKDLGGDAFKLNFEKAKNGEPVIFKMHLFIGENDYWIEAHLEPIFNKKGEIYRVLLWTLDISKEKFAEEALIENKRKYESLFMNSNDGLLVFEENNNGGMIIDCNKKVKDIFGYSQEELIKSDLFTLFPEVQPGGMLSKDKHIQKVIDLYKGENRPYFWKFKRKNNEIFEAEMNLALIKINDKKYLSASIRDISERKFDS